MRDNEKQNRFGYANEIASLAVRSTASEAVTYASHEVSKLVYLANENWLDFDPLNSELLVMGEVSKRKLDISDLSVSLRGNYMNPSLVR